MDEHSRLQKSIENQAKRMQKADSERPTLMAQSKRPTAPSIRV